MILYILPKKKVCMHTAKFKALHTSTFARCLPAQTDRYLTAIGIIMSESRITLMFFYFKNFEMHKFFSGNPQYLLEADVE